MSFLIDKIQIVLSSGEEVWNPNAAWLLEKNSESI